jgi:CRP-like cAMP-binding protein
MATDFHAILDQCAATKAVKVDVGKAVFRQGEAIRWLYRVATGGVRLSRVLARGTEITLARSGENDILAEASVFAARYHCDAIAETQSTLTRYSMRDIHALLKAKPEAAMAYGAHLAAELMNLRAIAEIRAIRRADERLLAWLHLRSSGASAAFDGKGAWPSVAKQIGLTGESIYRALARLERAGKIRRERGKIELATARVSRARTA